MAIGVDGAHRLVLRWMPHLHAKLLAPRRAQTVTLLPGVAGITFGYFKGTSGWTDHWEGNDPPDLLRVHLAFINPNVRWPDVIVAPMQQRDDE